MTKITTYLFAIFILLSTNLIAQDEKPPIKVEGKVTNYITGQALAGITITVFKNGSVAETKTTSSSGKYKLTDFELDNKYKVIISGGGMVTRFVEIDLTGIPNSDVQQKGWEVPLDMRLVERLPSIDFSTLEPKRSSIIKHNKSTGELDWNMGEIESYKKELEKLLKKIEAEKQKQEEEKLAQEKKYTDAFTAAEAAFKANDFQTAINKYKEALAAKPTDKATIDKLKIAETKYKEFQGAANLKKEYDDLMTAGNEKLKIADYDNAIATYKQALTKIPNDATANQKIKEAEAAKKGAVDKQYTDLLARADKAFKEKDYSQAKSFYKDASGIKPLEALPTQKIKEINDIIKKDVENETKYEAFIANANKDLIAKKFEGAITNFNEALKIRPSDAEATKGLTEAKKAKELADKEVADAANKQKEFDALVANADKEFIAKNYDAAIKSYNDALLKFDKPEIRKKIFDAEAAKKKLEEENAAKNAALAKKAEYDKFIADGNSSLSAKSYDDALTKYQSALATGINNVEAQKKITEAQTAKDLAAKADAEKIAAEKKKQDFNDLMASGDTKLAAKDFDNSIADYTKALGMKIDDFAANKKIADAKLAKAAFEKEKADKALAEANAKKKTEFDTFIAAGDSKLAAKDFTNSVAEYTKALQLKIDDATATAKIKAANDAKTAYDLEQKDAQAKADALKKKAEFDAIIAAGDGKMASKDFDKAIIDYNKALLMKVDDATANAKIKEANEAKIAFEKEKAAQADLAQKKKLYEAEIAKAQKDFDAGEFTAAIDKYKLALTYIPDDAFAKGQIDKCNAKIEEKKKFAEEQLAKLLEQADKDFTAEKYTDAKGYYERYLKQRPADAHSIARIKECDAKVKEKELIAAEAKKKAEFDAIIAAGNGKLTAKEFDLAVTEYKKALLLKVDDATVNAKIKEATDAKIAFEKDKAAQADMAQKKKLYDEAIAKGQKDFDAGEFTAAIDKYNSALSYIPDDAFAKGQIDKCNAKIEEKKKFAEEQLAKLLEQADKDFTAEKYADAKGYYERYLKQRPGDAHSTERIKECTVKMNDLAANAKIEAAYKDFMLKADAAFGAKKYDDAVALYNGALGVKVGDADATTKKEQAIKAKADSANAALMAANKAKYDAIIKKATGLFDSGEFTSSITEYNNALAVIPGDAYATGQIEKANQKIKEKQEFAEQQLAKLLEQADKDFTEEKYADAKGYYERYLKQRPTDAHSISRVKECDDKMKALANDAAAKAKADAAYKAFMAKGETALKANKFDEAILDFDAALGVKAADALATEKKELAQKMKVDFANASSQAALKKRYDEFIGKANKFFDAGDFTHAITEYNNALGVIPADDYATKRIALANERIESKKKEVEEMLAKLLSAADNEFKDGNWTDAKGYYERYVKIRPDNTYAVNQIKECDAKLKEELANANNKAALEARYKKFMDDGNALAALKKYDEAIQKFTGALQTKENDVPAQTRINEMNKLKDDLFNQAKANASAKENQARYDAAIALGNTEYTEGDFDPAIDAYKDALNYKPLDKYATDQIKKCMKDKARKIEEGLAMYKKIIETADKFFDGKNFTEAKGLYERAQKFKPDDSYPPQRIEECIKMMNKPTTPEHFELVHSGTIVTGSTVLEGQKMIEEAKRQEKYRAEQNYVAIYDNNVKYHDGMNENDKEASLNTQDNFNLEAFNREQMFRENDDQRLYKVDSVADYIDKRQEAYRGALHAQDQSNLARQDNFNEFEYNTEQLFKGKDAMRVYKVDSVKFYKDYKDEVYRQTIKNSNNDNYIKQGNFNEFEYNTEQIFKGKDELRQYMVDSVKFYKDLKDELYRQTQKNYNEENYVKQANFNEFEVYTEQLYKGKDAMRIYKVDSVKFYKDYKDEMYRQTIKNSDQVNYIKQANFNEFESYTEQLYTQKDEMRQYLADSVKFYKDYKDQQYRETQHDQSVKNYNKQLDFDQREIEKEQLLKEKDELRKESVAEVNLAAEKRDAFVAEVKNSNANATANNNNEFITGEERRDAFAKEGSGKYLNEASDYVIKNENVDGTLNEFKKDGDQLTNKNNEKFKTTSPVVPKVYDTGHLTRIAAEYGPGIHQWTTHKYNGNNVVNEICTRRVVIVGSTANDYMMTVNKWGTNYTKNGKIIGDHVWQLETGGNIIEHDK